LRYPALGIHLNDKTGIPDNESSVIDHLLASNGAKSPNHSPKPITTRKSASVQEF
jgi:hypothetical protein